VDLAAYLCRGVDFELTDIGGQLTLGRKVLDADHIVVDQFEVADSDRRQLQGHLPADRSDADDDGAIRRQLLRWHQLALADVPIGVNMAEACDWIAAGPCISES
jgi:hypothetical protein